MVYQRTDPLFHYPEAQGIHVPQNPPHQARVSVGLEVWRFTQSSERWKLYLELLHGHSLTSKLQEIMASPWVTYWFATIFWWVSSELPMDSWTPWMKNLPTREPENEQDILKCCTKANLLIVSYLCNGWCVVLVIRTRVWFANKNFFASYAWSHYA